MSHEISYNCYDVKKSKKEIEGILNTECKYSSDSRSGLPSSIKWIDTTFESEEEAHDYINSIDKGWYEQIAVKFKKHERPTKEKLVKYEELCKIAEDCRKAFSQIDMVEYFKDYKKEFITCPHCKSKLNTETYKTHTIGHRKNCCSVCNEDMRPKTEIAKIEKAKAKWNTACEKAKAEYTKQESKTKTNEMWLVKTEWHC